MPYKEYTVSQIGDIVYQLRNVKVQGQPVMEVDVEYRNTGMAVITMNNWGTVAILEYHLTRRDAELVNPR
jgi:hypothetical protein